MNISFEENHKVAIYGFDYYRLNLYMEDVNPTLFVFNKNDPDVESYVVNHVLDRKIEEYPTEYKHNKGVELESYKVLCSTSNVFAIQALLKRKDPNGEEPATFKLIKLFYRKVPSSSFHLFAWVDDESNTYSVCKETLELFNPKFDFEKYSKGKTYIPDIKWKDV